MRDLLPPKDPVPDAVARIERNRAGASPDPTSKALTAALHLLDIGASIIPVKTYSKEPTRADWDRATRSYPQTFLKNPGTHNYGVMPPPGCVILDVDKGALALLLDLTEHLGILPETLIHQSPNGQHWFFRWPQSVPRPVGPWWGTIVARWPHKDPGQGYVVGPGSQVTQADGSIGDYAVLHDSDIAELPEMWAQHVVEWRPPHKADLSTLGTDWGSPDDRYDLPVSVPEGGRYEAILRFTAHKYNLRLGREEVFAALQADLVPRFEVALTVGELRSRFRRAWQGIESRLGPPATPEPLPAQVGDPSGLFGVAPTSAAPLDTMRHAGLQQRGAADQHDAVVATDPRHAPVQPASTPAPPSSTPSPPTAPDWTSVFVSAARLRDDLAAMGPVPYLVDDLVVAGGLNIVGGLPKSGKSLGLLQMLAAFVVGKPFLTHDTLDSGTRVALYATQEGSRLEMQTRLDRLLVAFPGLGASNRFRVAYNLAESFTFDAKQQVRVGSLLNGVIASLSGRPHPLHLWLVLDPLRDFMPLGGDENEAKVMAVVKAWCRGLLTAFNQTADVSLTITLVHHLRKSASGDTGIELSGSGALYGMTDGTIIWRATKTEEVDPVALFIARPLRGSYHVETRGGEPTSRGWRYDSTSGLIVPALARSSGRVPTVSPTGVPASPTQDTIVDLLDSAGLAGMHADDLAAQLGISSGSVRKQLSRLRVEGAVVKVGDNWHLTQHTTSNDPAGLIPPDDPDDD